MLNLMIALNAISFIGIAFVLFVAFQFSNHINGFRLFIYVVG